jgi:hypothetical protein
MPFVVQLNKLYVLYAFVVQYKLYVLCGSFKKILML